MPKSYSDRERGYIRKRLKEEAAACMGLCQIFQVFQQRQFQSTLPVWGATSRFSAPAHIPPDFNPRSPCGERQAVFWTCTAANIFQSTLPVWGATVCLVGAAAIRIKFQSTLPVWGATPKTSAEALAEIISIHAPRVGSDSSRLSFPMASYNFNPRSPCGERPRGRVA